MANRVLRDYTDSEKMNSLSFQAECFFVRLITKVDDFGSFHANPKLILAATFPMKKVAEKDIEKWVLECQKQELLFTYTVKGKKYLRISNFGQRIRNMRNRFPNPIEGAEDETNTEIGSDSQQVAANDGLKLETRNQKLETKPKLETETATLTNISDSTAQFQTPSFSSSKKVKHGFRESEYFDKEKFSAALDSSPPPYCNANVEFYYDAALNGSDSKGYKYLDWMAAIKNWMRNDISKDQFKTKFSEPKKINGSTSKFDKSQQITDHNNDQLRRIMDGSL
jgi:hypothetical protein